MLNQYNIFSVQLTHLKLPLNIDTHKKIISFIDDEYKEENFLSCKKGFQFHEDFSGKKELNNFLNRNLKNYFCLQTVNEWLNVLGNKSYNRPHAHNGDNVQFSGIYYLSDNNSVITFLRENEIFELEPKLFDLLIFPYNLVHYVLPTERSKKRICYAFNLTTIKEE